MSNTSHGSGSGNEGHLSTRSVSLPANINRTDYVIKVKTSDRFGAGTDASVFIELHGEFGSSSEPILLKNSQHMNKFERDQVDQFTFTNQISLGDLKSLKIWHDNKGIGASWHLEYIEISDTGAGLRYRFPCHRWLSTSEEDGQVSREIKCTEVLAGPKYAIQTATGVLKKQDYSTTLITPSIPSFALGGSTSAHSSTSLDDSLVQDHLHRSSLSNSTITSTIGRHNSPSNNNAHHHLHHHQQHNEKPSFIHAHHKVEVFGPKPDSRRGSSASNANGATTSSSIYGPYASNPNSSSTNTSSGVTSLTANQQPVRKVSGHTLYGPYSKR